MDTTLTLNAYNYFPNIKKLIKDGTSQFDYITLCFEASFNNQDLKNPTKINVNNFVFVSSLFVDYYIEDENNKHLTINFDIMETNDDGVALDCYTESKKYIAKSFSSNSTKKVKVEEQYDVKCKRQYSLQLSDKYLTMSEAFKEFYSEQIEQQYSQIEPFLINNKINYNKKQLNNFLSVCLLDASKCFTKEYLNLQNDSILAEKVNAVEAKLSAQHLEKELPINLSSVKSNKI